jgi:hypothetical protein
MMSEREYGGGTDPRPESMLRPARLSGEAAELG